MSASRTPSSRLGSTKCRTYFFSAPSKSSISTSLTTLRLLRFRSIVNSIMIRLGSRSSFALSHSNSSSASQPSVSK